MIDMAVRLAREAGGLLLDFFHRRLPLRVRFKGDLSNVLTEADLASEALIRREIRHAFPGHAVMAEEAGYAPGAASTTWIVDPLDGTSNFAAGLPWFGVLLAVLERNEPTLAVLHLPASGETYHAVRGGGAFHNGRPVRVSGLREPARSLWACAMDAPRHARDARTKAFVMAELLKKVRGVRTTNSLVDAAFTADGRLGGWINLDTRIWDIAAPSLIIREAGGRFTDRSGADVEFDLSSEGADRVYEIVAGARAQHEQIVRVVQG